MKTTLPPPPMGPPPPSLASNHRQPQPLNQNHNQHPSVLPIVSLSTSTSTDEEEEQEQDEQPNEASTTVLVDRQRALLDDVVILSKSSSASSSHDDDEQQQQKNDAMAYLLRYEVMVRQQEAEDMAVLAHMRPCVGRLLELMEQAPTLLVREHDSMDFLTQEVSFVQLQHAVRRLEQSLQANNHDSGNDKSSTSNQPQSPMEHLTTDRQLMMVLRLLTQKVDSNDDDDDDDDNHATTTKNTITWAEIVQCYKVCIAGMLTLQHLPPNTAARARARDRTLAMLSLFEPPSTQLFQEDVLLRKNKNAKQKSSQKIVKQHNKHRVVDSEPLTMASPRFVPLPCTDPTATKTSSNKARPARRYWNTNRKLRRLLAVLALVALCSGLLLCWYDDSNHQRTIETCLVSWTRPRRHPSAAAPRSVVSRPVVHPTHETSSSPSAPVKNHRSSSAPVAEGKRPWVTPKQHQQQPTWHMDPFVGASDRLVSTVCQMLRRHSKKSSVPLERRA